jgi:osmotically inducible protein OsmC
MASKASAVWTGSLKEGKGTISTATGVLSNANYSFATHHSRGTDCGGARELLFNGFGRAVGRRRADAGED